MQDHNDPLAIDSDAWEGGNFEKDMPTAGEHQAVCCQIHNLGYQEYQGKVSPSPKCVLIFELDEKMKGGELAGKPFVVSDNFNMFMAPGSKLRDFLEGWRGQPFDTTAAQNFSLRNLLGKPCTLMLIHKKKEKGNGMKPKIVGITKAKGPALPVTYTEKPKWVAEMQEKQVPPKQKASAAPAVPANPSHQELEEKLPF